MRAQDLSDAIGLLDEQMVGEALDAAGSPDARRRTYRIRLWVPLAACACLTVLLVGAAAVFGPDADAPSGDVRSAPLVIPSRQEAAAKAVSVHEAQPKYFVYQGQSYVRKPSLGEVPSQLAGEYLGTVDDGQFDDGDEDGVVDMAGNVAGDLYTLKGYDSDFMVCLASPGDGQRQVFMRDSGLTLAAGSELFEDRLHLAGGYEGAYVQVHEDWESGLAGTQRELDAPSGVLDAFVRALDSGYFVSEEAAAGEQGWEAMADAPWRRHVIFRMKDGLLLPVNLYANGESSAWYASYDGLAEAFIRIDLQDAAGFLSALDAFEDTYAEAKEAYGRFLQGKKGYFRIMRFAGMDAPALLVSKKRDPATDGVFGCTVYEFADGRVRKAGKVRCTSTAYNVCAYQGYLFYGSHHYSGFVTVEAGVLCGEMYTEKWNGDDDDVSYYKALLSNGEQGPKERVDEHEGAARLAAEEELGACAVEFARIG